MTTDQSDIETILKDILKSLKLDIVTDTSSSHLSIDNHPQIITIKGKSKVLRAVLTLLKDETRLARIDELKRLKIYNWNVDKDNNGVAFEREINTRLMTLTNKDTDGHIHYWLPVEDKWKCNCGEVKQ